jgi:hypothetical protein
MATLQVGVGPVGAKVATWSEVPERFTSWIDGDDLLVSFDEVRSFAMRHPQPCDPDVYQGYDQDPRMVPEDLREFSVDDPTTFDRDVAHLAGVAYGGVVR